jgi:hypothetical protein
VAGFAPFGIQNIDGTLFVTYAKQNAAKHDDVEGPGNGFIDEFDTSGHFLMRFASGTAAGGTLTALNSPWGMAVAPDDFGKFGGALLVGNFGDSHVSAFDLESGRFLGQLEDARGNPLVLNGGFQGADTKGLWGIAFGRDGDGRPTLFFAAGIGDESHGVFGKVTSAEGEGEGGGDHHQGDQGGDNHHEGDQGGDNHHEGDQGGDNGPGRGDQHHRHGADRAGRRHHRRHGRAEVIRASMGDLGGG